MTRVEVGGDKGGSVRSIWHCPICRNDEYWEPRGARYVYPVVRGEQSNRCPDCGHKLERIG